MTDLTDPAILRHRQIMEHLARDPRSTTPYFQTLNLLATRKHRLFDHLTIPVDGFRIRSLKAVALLKEKETQLEALFIEDRCW
jgi:uncharacterized radical SAM superfamily protein